MDLRISYREWHQPPKERRGEKGIDYIRCRDGSVYSTKDWLCLAQQYIAEHELSDLYEQIKEYVRHNCLWVKDVDVYSASSLLRGSYTKWDDFMLQETLQL